MALVDDFKNAVSSWASGVSVVCIAADGRSYGMTVSAFTSLSLEPPLVLVCLHQSSRILQRIPEVGRFSISILAMGQKEVSDFHAGRQGITPPPDAWVHWTPAGDPVIQGAASWLICGVHQIIDGGDHSIVIGRVEEVATQEQEAPLVYHRRGYKGLTG